MRHLTIWSVSDPTRMTTVDDATALAGPVIDVAARIGWTLRVARMTAQSGDTRMRSMAEALATSAARISRVETGQIRDGAIVDGYERFLGLSEGSLRAPIDILCRTFPATSPVDVRPGLPITAVQELSRLTERMTGAETVTGGEWLRWSGAISAPGNIGLPVPLARTLVRRLVHELSRSVRNGYPTRYEALARIRCSEYGFLVLDAAREEVAHPHAQALADLLSAVGEAATPDAIEWCLQLLVHDEPYVAMCGALGLENMAEITGPPEFWNQVAPALLDAFESVSAGSMQDDWIAHLIRLVPTEIWRRLGRRPSRLLPPAPEVEGLDRDATSGHWQQCREASRRIGEKVGIGEQPMLARLMFDVAYGHWETRAVTGYFLLGALPRIAEPTWNQLARMVEIESDERIRHRMARRIHGALQGEASSIALRWLDSPDHVLRSAGLQVAGAAGQHVPVEDLRRALMDPETRRAAAFAAGMSEHPALDELACDPALDGSARGAAGWWVSRGGRLVV
jgi:hypothetical protein